MELALVSLLVAFQALTIVGLMGMSIRFQTFRFGVKKIMSNVNAIAESLARSTETVEAAARSVTEFGKTVLAIKSDVAALKQAIENNFNVGSIRAVADALESSASNLAAGLSRLGADLVAIDNSVPEAPPVADEPDLADATEEGGEGETKDDEQP